MPEGYSGKSNWETSGMAERNFSMVEYLNRRAEDWQPTLAFSSKTPGDWSLWQAEALERLRQLLGEYPESVDMNAEVVHSVERDGLVRERVVFDSESGMSVPCVLLKLPDIPNDGSAPAILCCHGHGPHGKEPLVGNPSTEGLRDDMVLHPPQKDNYAEQMARRGFVTLSPDLRRAMRTAQTSRYTE